MSVQLPCDWFAYCSFSDDENLGAIVSGSIVSNLKFADDIGLLSESADDLQTLIDRAQAESSRFGLTINTAKTEVQCISPLEHVWTSTIDGVPLRRAKEFVYLGGKMTEAADSKAYVDRRIGLATGVAGNLAVIWRSKDIGLMTKTRLYKAMVLSVLLCNAETWTMTEEIGRKLLAFEMAVLRRLGGISRWDRRRNVDIRRGLEIKRDVVNQVRSRRLSYFGHVVRMSPNRIPNIMLYGRVHGKRPVGRPKKRWLDNVREDCKILGLTVKEADQLARDRARWRSGVTRLLERADLYVSQEQ